MNRIDAIVESRRWQKSNEPHACFWTVDQGNEVAWVPLKEKTGFSTKHDFMTRGSQVVRVAPTNRSLFG